MHLLSRLTRRHVTVALSGDGGDELFGGYGRYFQQRSVAQAAALSPSLRRLAQAVIHALPGPHGPASARCCLLDFVRRIWATSSTCWIGFDRQAGRCLSPDHQLLAGPRGARSRRREAPDLAGDARIAALLPDFTERMQFIDTSTILRDSLLAKVDRASMAVGWSAATLLDHRVVAFSWSLRRHENKGRTSKWRWPGAASYVPANCGAPQNGIRRAHRRLVARTLARLAENLLDEKR